MLPVRNDRVEIKSEVEAIPTKTYKMAIFGEKITGKTDGQEAMKQAIYKILNTERYQYPIYSWNYGIELKDLFGKSKSYCKVELVSRVSEALLQDERIIAVESFLFDDTKKRESLAMAFTAKTIYGDVEIAKEVKVA